jgi:hypothetical protein
MLHFCPDCVGAGLRSIVTVTPGHSVAIVVSNEYGSILTALALQQDLWALRTPETEAVAQWFWDNQPTGDTSPLGSGVTLFNGDGKPESDLLSILDEVVLHHGSRSQAAPLDAITVYGAELTDASREAFRSLGFSHFDQHPGIFVASRSPSFGVS